MTKAIEITSEGWGTVVIHGEDLTADVDPDTVHAVLTIKDGGRQVAQFKIWHHWKAVD